MFVDLKALDQLALDSNTKSYENLSDLTVVSLPLARTLKAVCNKPAKGTKHHETNNFVAINKTQKKCKWQIHPKNK